MFLGKEDEIRECIIQNISDGSLRIRVIETISRYKQDGTSHDSHNKDYVNHTMDFSLSNFGTEMNVSIPLGSKEIVRAMIKALQNVEERIETPHSFSPLSSKPRIEIADGKAVNISKKAKYIQGS